MKRLCTVTAFLCVAASAQVQKLELKELPPLKPLNWCTDSNGVTRGQIEECGPGTTVGTSVSTAKFPENESKPVAAIKSEVGVSRNEPIDASADSKNSYWKQWGKWIGLALFVGLLLKWLRRST